MNFVGTGGGGMGSLFRKHEYVYLGLSVLISGYFAWTIRSKNLLDARDSNRALWIIGFSPVILFFVLGIVIAFGVFLVAFGFSRIGAI